GLSCHHEQGLREKQSGGEFASSGAPAGAQDATLQISGIGATLSERSCRRPQYLQPPAPSRLPVDASDLPIRSSGAMAQRDRRGMTTVRAPRILTRTPQLDSALGAAHHAHGNVATGGARSDGGSNLRLSRIARRVYRHLLRRGSRRHDLAVDDVYREPWRKLSDRGDYRADPAGPFDRLYAADRAVSEYRDARQSRLIKSRPRARIEMIP